MEQYCVLGKPCIWTPVWPTKVTTTRNRSVHFFVFTSKNISQWCLTDMFRIFQKDFDKRTKTFLFSLMKYISPSILHLPRLLKHVYFKWWLRQTKRKHGGAFWLFCLSYFLADPSSYPQERTQEMKGRKKEVKDGSSEKYTLQGYKPGILGNA